MTKQLPDEIRIAPTHTPGRHCASTAVRDLVNHHGFGWSEARCFGLGAGMGLWYIGGIPGLGASRLLHVRSGDFEAEFFDRIGVDFAWHSDPDPAVTERDLRAALAEGRPAILRTNIRHLPYYGTDTDFPGHCIGAWGYDRGGFLVADTERPDLIHVPYEAMRRARYAEGPPFEHHGDFFAPERLEAPAGERLAGMMRAAIRANAEALAVDDNDLMAKRALDRLRSELADGTFAGFEDWAWTARFLYQIIEKRGTGGGGFRLMYSEFLDEVAEFVPEVTDLGLSELARDAAAAWTELAVALKAASERDAPGMREAAAKADRVVAAERTYLEAAHRLPMEG